MPAPLSKQTIHMISERFLIGPSSGVDLPAKDCEAGIISNVLILQLKRFS